MNAPPTQPIAPSPNLRVAAMATWMLPVCGFFGQAVMRRAIGPVLSDLVVLLAIGVGGFLGIGALIVGRRNVGALLVHVIIGYVVIAFFVAIFVSNFVAMKQSPPREASSMSDSNEQAVLIHFKYGSTELSALHALEEKLEAVLTPEIGEHDGHEIAVNGSDGTLYFYGPDADRLWKAIAPTVRAAPFMHEAQVVLRAGSPGVGKEKTVTLP